MCGLFGFSGHQPVDVTKLRWLAVENESRGHHSMGIYTQKRDKEETNVLFKDTGLATMLINNAEFINALPGAFNVQGHTRAATVGSITKENAHPFLYDFTGQGAGTVAVGAHNGFVMDEFKGAPQWKQFGFDKKFDVDSMLIFAALAKTGDYNVLPSIEGGIACSFQMPNRHPNALFLYQSSGRELHFGLAKEGIYYSSESTPLRYLGCKSISTIPYNSLVVLDNGSVLDIVSMPKPEVSMRYNAKRDGWHEGMSAAELERMGFPELADKVKAPASHHNFQTSAYTKKPNDGQCKLPSSIAKTATGKTIPMSGQTTNDASLRENRDQLSLLVNDIKTSIEAIVDEPLLYQKSTSYTTQDTDSCLMLIKLIGSVHKQKLPAWVIYSETDSQIAGVTALNGITILKFPEALCGKKHKLLLTCPASADNPDLFSIIVDPVKSRVMEVTLELPFPSRVKKNTETSNKSTVDNSGTTALVRLGESQLSLYASGLNPSRGILSADRNLSEAVQAEQVHTRHQEEQSIESQSSSSTDLSINGDSTKEVHQGEHLGSELLNSRVGKSIVIVPPINNIATLRSILAEENRTFKNKDVVKKMLLSQEYSLASSTWTAHLGDKLNIKKLLSDACIIKLSDLSKWDNAMSLSYYCWKLAANLSDNYLIRPNRNDEEAREFHSALGTLLSTTNIRGNSSEVGDGKKQWKKLELVV